MAPRPLLLTNATGDQWANPTGQFAMLKAAEPVFKLLGTEGCGPAEMPPGKSTREHAPGLFHPARQARHEPIEWAQWLDFANKHLPK